MAAKKLINRFLLIGFLILVGFCLAKSLQNGSSIGFILALVSLGAAVYFIYLLQQLGNPRETEEAGY